MTRPAPVDPYAVACPLCGAEAGKPCRDLRTWRPYIRGHHARHHKAHTEQEET